MTEEELRQRNFELAEENKTLSDTIKNLLSPKKTEPEHLTSDDVGPGGKCAGQIDLHDIASGRVIVDMPKKKPVEVKTGEIYIGDPDLPNHLDEVASGKLKVVG